MWGTGKHQVSGIRRQAHEIQILRSLITRLAAKNATGVEAASPFLDSLSKADDLKAERSRLKAGGWQLFSAKIKRFARRVQLAIAFPTVQ